MRSDTNVQKPHAIDDQKIYYSSHPQGSTNWEIKPKIRKQRITASEITSISESNLIYDSNTFIKNLINQPVKDEPKSRFDFKDNNFEFELSKFLEFYSK